MSGLAHDGDHEALLEQVLVGDLSLDDPRIQALRHQCDQCRADLAELLGLLAGLDTVMDRPAAADPGEGDPVDVRESWQRLTTPRRRTPLWIPLAALVVLSVSLWAALQGSPMRLDPTREDFPLSGGVSFESVRWNGRSLEVDWRAEKSPLDLYHVVIRDAEAPADAPALAELDTEDPWVRIDGSYWPDSPRRIRIEVEVRSFDDGSTLAWREWVGEPRER